MSGDKTTMIEVTVDMLKLLAKVQEYYAGIGEEISLPQAVNALCHFGELYMETLRTGDPDRTPVGELTVRQLGEMLGSVDLRAARADALKQRRLAQEALSNTHEIFRHVQALRQFNQLRVFNTAKEWAEYAHGMLHNFQDAPEVRLVMVSVWAEKEGYRADEATPPTRAN